MMNTWILGYLNSIGVYGGMLLAVVGIGSFFIVKYIMRLKENIETLSAGNVRKRLISELENDVRKFYDWWLKEQSERSRLKESCEKLSNESKMYNEWWLNRVSENKRLEERCETLSNDIKVLKERCETLLNDKEVLEQKCETLVKENHQLRSSISGLQDDVQKLKESCETLSNDNKVLKERCETLLNDKEVLEQKCETLTKENHQQRSSISGLQDDVQKYKQLWLKEVSEKSGFVEQCGSLSKEIEVLKNNASIKDEEARKLNEKLKARYMLVEVDRESKKFEKLELTFRKSAKNHYVVKIEKVVNKSLRAIYIARKKTVKEECQTAAGIKQALWHGTATDSVDGICANGFNRSYAGKNDTAYGEGTYFSTAAYYSAEYSLRGHRTTTDDNGATKSYYMFLSKVLTGKYCRGKRGEKDTPTGYHSTVDHPSNPTRFIVYQDGAAYPKYLFTFRTGPVAS